MENNIYAYTVKDIDGEDVPLSHYRGKTLLVVNVASKCGFTPQYSGLQALYEKYQGQDFVILAFPCNQFLSQEPGDENEIKSFCTVNYGVSFPLFAKIEVNGEGAHPLYSYLKKAQKGLLGSEAIKWNFTKFLVNKQGIVTKRFSPQTKPEELESEILAIL